MSKFILILFLLTSVMTAQAKDIVVAVSPHFSQEKSKNMLNEMATLYSGLALGDTLTFLNGRDGHVIANVRIPNEDAYRHRVTKLRHGAKALARVNVFIKSMKQGKRTLGAMDVPLVLSQIAHTYPNASDILLVGSALYDNPTQPGVDMTSRLIPSDGFITAKPTDSPFGTKGREKHLQGKRIHWLLPKASNDSLHGEALLRFMHLWIYHLGGSLISFTHNDDAVMQLLQKNAQAMPMHYQLDASDKMFMQAVRKLILGQSLYQQAVSQDAISKDTLNSLQTLKVGIEWQGQNVDLDIYASPQYGELLYYKHPVTRFGKHYKDVLSGNSKNGQSQYETIEFHAPIKPKALLIGVNVYSTKGRPHAIKGTLRLKIAGLTYAKPFRFLVSSGNAGKDIQKVLESGVDTAHSKRFTIMDIAGMEEVKS